MQEAFLAAVNKSRQRQPIKGCSVCGQQGHTEQSLLLVETGPSQCAAAGTQSTLIHAARPSAHGQAREGLGAPGHRQTHFHST